jgi:hypothetical protein
MECKNLKKREEQINRQVGENKSRNQPKNFKRITREH